MIAQFAESTIEIEISRYERIIPVCLHSLSSRVNLCASYHFHRERTSRLNPYILWRTISRRVGQCTFRIKFFPRRDKISNRENIALEGSLHRFSALYTLAFKPSIRIVPCFYRRSTNFPYPTHKFEMRTFDLYLDSWTDRCTLDP